ncbi:hypothetical protein D3C76_1739330 [compost metagenome]
MLSLQSPAATTPVLPSISVLLGSKRYVELQVVDIVLPSSQENDERFQVPSVARLQDWLLLIIELAILSTTVHSLPSLLTTSYFLL